MKQYDEAIFEAALEITASAAEEAEMTMDAAGGKAAAEFFRAVYDGIAAEDENAEGGVFEVYQDRVVFHIRNTGTLENYTQNDKPKEYTVYYK